MKEIELKEKVLKTIKKYHLIEPGDKIVVGVSGGPDSISLLHILSNLKEKLNFQIYVAHINHLIREEAEEETQYVKEFCNNLGIDCYIKRAKVTQIAQEQKIGTEEAGRNVRYDFFEEVLKTTNSNKIAIAHNANDNAETVLMNIFRGSGTNGLKGIEPYRENKFIRPLIECTRDEIELYCEKNSLNPKIDRSNFENIYTRNKIRNIVIPKIKQEFNPNIIQSLNKLSALAREENSFVENYVEKIMESGIILNDNSKEEHIALQDGHIEDHGLILDLKKFNQLDHFIKSKVIIKCITMVLGSANGIEKVHIDDVVEMCEKNIGNKYMCPNKKIKISVKKGKIFIDKNK